MSETLIYADLNLPQSTRPSQQKITNVQDSTYAEVKVQALDTNPEASYTSAGKRCCSRTCVAGVVAVILLLLVLAVCLILILTAATGNGKGPQQPGENGIFPRLFFPSAPCPDGWKRHGKKCYLFHALKEWHSWNTSYEECTKMGASLVVIENKEELDYLSSRSQCCYYLLGLRYSESEEKWKWINDVEHSTDMFHIQRHPDYFCAVIRGDKVESTACTGDSTTQTMCEKAADSS